MSDKKIPAIAVVLVVVAIAIIILFWMSRRKAGDEDEPEPRPAPGPCTHGDVFDTYCPATNDYRPGEICDNGVWKKVPDPCPQPICDEGETRLEKCPGGGTVTTKICVNGRWQETNNKCPDAGIDPNYIKVTLTKYGDIRIDWYDQKTHNMDGNMTPIHNFLDVINIHYGRGDINSTQLEEATIQFHNLGLS